MNEETGAQLQAFLRDAQARLDRLSSEIESLRRQLDQIAGRAPAPPPRQPAPF